MRQRLTLFGCSVAGLAILGYASYALMTFRGARLGLLALALFVVFTFGLQRWRLHRAISDFRKVHSASGRDLLIVYSSSPHWQQYIEEKWISRWQDRAVLLNRSAPDWQTRPETRLWRRLAGLQNHTPVAIVVPKRGATRIVRFYSAFQDYKHGKPSALHAKEEELENILRSSDSV